MDKIIFNDKNIKESLESLYENERVKNTCIYIDEEGDDYTFFGENSSDSWSIKNNNIHIKQEIRIYNSYNKRNLEQYFKNNISNKISFKTINEVGGKEVNWITVELKIELIN